MPSVEWSGALTLEVNADAIQSWVASLDEAERKALLLAIPEQSADLGRGTRGDRAGGVEALTAASERRREGGAG
jgi:hypothetical protein